MIEAKGNIIITGFQGFIGIYTTAKFMNEGYIVHGVDIGKVDKQKFQLIKKLLVNEDILYSHLKTYFNFDMTEHSLETLELVNTYAERKKTIDLVIHYASPVGVKMINDNPYKCMKDALTMNMMIDDYCTKYKIPLIFSSSSEVFGRNENIFVTSNYEVKQNPRGTYAGQKLASELLFNNNPNYSSAMIRFFNVVGFGQTTQGMVMNTFIDNIFKGIPLRVLEKSSRSFCAVKDAVEMVYEAYQNIIIKQGISPAKLNYNIGNPNKENYLSINELATKIIDIYNKEVKNSKTYEQDILELYRDDDIPYIKIRRLANTGLSFNKFTHIDDIIKDYLKHYQGI